MTEEQTVASLAWATNEITALRAKVASLEAAQSARNEPNIASPPTGDVVEALHDWRNSWLCPATDFEACVDRLLANTAAALATLQPADPVEPKVSSDVVEQARKLAADIMVAVRQARFPKEYYAEAHDEFESLTLTPMLLATPALALCVAAWNTRATLDPTGEKA